MKNLSLIASALAMLGLTACEKGLDEGIADVAPAGQVMNSVLQVRTRSGGSAGGEATGINAVNGSEFMINGSDIYNLAGQRVAQPTQKGLYIVNGKKVVIK